LTKRTAPERPRGALELRRAIIAPTHDDAALMILQTAALDRMRDEAGLVVGKHRAEIAHVEPATAMSAYST